MRLDTAPALAAPAIHVADDPFAPPPPRGDRRLKVLDFLVAAVVVAAGGAVVANALMLQAPAPGVALLGSGAPVAGDKAKAVRSTSIPLPPVNPNARGAAGAAGASTGALGYLASKTSVTGMTPPLKPVSAEEAAAGAIAAPRPVASLRPSLKTGALDATGPLSVPAGTASAASSGDPLPIRPPADVPSSPRVLAVQRALAKLGYGPLKVNGAMSAETRQAIQRFERDRKLPADGEVTDRLVRELGAVSGLAIN
ncbi:peptidoglycan-binding domain-containing protein [Xanthobacter sp. V4C-4]|uniref:peptidoglycan-binding domain-containing protein n=1 Tax=Xanthobacter cornucopiae TaxID=3119924 RepID=UPI003726B769